MYSRLAAIIIGLAAAALAALGVFCVGAGLLDLDNPWAGLLFTIAGAGLVGALLLGLTARALWHDRILAWAITAAIGALGLLASLSQASSIAGGGPPAILIVLPGAIGAALVAMAILRWQQRRASA